MKNLVKENGKYIIETKEDDNLKIVALFVKRNIKSIIKDLETLYDFKINNIKIGKFLGETNTGFFMYDTNIAHMSIGYDDEGGYKISGPGFQIAYDSKGKIEAHT